MSAKRKEGGLFAYEIKIGERGFFREAVVARSFHEAVKQAELSLKDNRLYTSNKYRIMAITEIGEVKTHPKRRAND